MKVHYTFPIHKIINEDLEIPDNLVEGKTNEEKLNIYKAAIANKFGHLKKQGFYILESEIEFNNETSEVI